jgi:AcrR family transcriptional regulator
MSLDLKVRVLNASEQLIAEAGLAGLSMREVARRAGVSHQAPYHYFEDKAAIIAALVARGFELLADRLEQASACPGTVAQKLEKVGRAYITFALDQPVYFRLMFRPELTDLKRYPDVDAKAAQAFGVLQKLVSELAGRRASPARKHALTSMHWSVAHGLATLLLDGNLGDQLGSRVARERHVDDVLRLFSAR